MDGRTRVKGTPDDPVRGEPQAPLRTWATEDGSLTLTFLADVPPEAIRLFETKVKLHPNDVMGCLRGIFAMSCTMAFDPAKWGLFHAQGGLTFARIGAWGSPSFSIPRNPKCMNCLDSGIDDSEWDGRCDNCAIGIEGARCLT